MTDRKKLSFGKKLLIGLIVLFVIGQFLNKSDTDTNFISEEVKEKASVDSFSTTLIEEIPEEVLCTADLGVLTMNSNGETQGAKTEMTELLKLLNNDCDIIEISYEMKGSYGDNIGKKIVYSKREYILKDIYSKNNISEDYRNVDPASLIAFLKAGEKSLYKLADYTDLEYDFNDRERINKVAGPEPAQSEWDGRVSIVAEFIKDNAKDPSSIKFKEWSKVSLLGDDWVVRCKYEGLNSLGAKTTENYWFYIQQNKVINAKKIN